MIQSDTVKIIRDITGRHGVTAPTSAAREIAQALDERANAYQQFAADVMAIWAGWTGGRLTEDDAMVAISDRHQELRQQVDAV